MATNIGNIFDIDTSDLTGAINTSDSNLDTSDLTRGIDTSDLTRGIDTSDLDLGKPAAPIDKESRIYKEVANSWSNRLDMALDGVKKATNEGLGLLASQLGADELAKSYREDAQQNEIDRASKPQPTITPSITETAGEVSDDIAEGQFMEAVEKIGTGIKALAAEAIPNMAPAVGGALAARALVPIIATIPGVGPPAAMISAVILTFGPGYLMGSGETYTRAKELGADETEASAAGVAGGFFTGLFDRFFAGLFVKNLVETVGKKEVVKQFAKRTSTEAAEEIVEKAIKAGSKETLERGFKATAKETLGGAIKGGLKIGGVGALTEGAQEVATELSASLAAGKFPEISELTRRTIDGAALGLVGGGMPGAVTGALTPMARREATRKAEELKENEQELKKEVKKEINEPDIPSMIDRSKDLDLQGEIDTPRISRNWVDKATRRAVTFLTEPAATNPVVAGLYNDLSSFQDNVNRESGKGLSIFSNRQNDIIQNQTKKLKLPWTKPIEKNIEQNLARTLRGQELNLDDFKGPKGKKQLKIIKDNTPVIRKILDDERKKSNAIPGIDIRYQEDYISQSIKLRKKFFGRKQDIEKLTNIFRYNNAKNKKTRYALSENAEYIVKNIVDNDGMFKPEEGVTLFNEGRSDSKLTAVEKSFEKERVIPKEVAIQLDEAGLLNNNVFEIVNKYIIESARRRRVQEIKNKYNNRVEELRLPKEDRRRVSNIFDALQNNYHRLESGPLAATRFATTGIYVTTLAHAGIISLSEPILVLSRVKPKHAIWGALKASKVTLDKLIRSFFPKFRKTDLENSFNLLHQTADIATVNVIRDIGDTTYSKKITDAFFKFTLLEAVTQFSRQMASIAVTSQMQEDILTVSDERQTGKETPEGQDARKRLDEQGLRNLFSDREIKKIKVKKPKGKKLNKKQQAKYERDKALRTAQRKSETNLPLVEEQVLNWAKSNVTTEQAIEQFGVFDVPLIDQVTIEKYGAEGTPPDIILASMSKTINEIIMAPNVINRPLWMSDPRFALVAILRGFMMVFGNTVGPKFYKEVIKPFNPLYKKRNAFIPGVKFPTVFKYPVTTFQDTFKWGLTASLLLSAMYGTQMMRNAIKFEDEENPFDDLNEKELFFKLLQQSNILGFGNIIIDSALSNTFGGTFVTSVLGPGASQVDRLVDGLVNLNDDRPRTLATWLAKNTPFTGALGTERRAEVPIVGTEAFEEYLESLMDNVVDPLKDILGMAEGGSIMDSLISPLNVGESEQLSKTLEMLKTNPDLLRTEEPYYDTHVMPDEFDKYSSPKHFNKKTNSYKVYQLKGEDRPTIGPGVYLDDNALKLLGLNNIPKKGLEINKDKVDSIGRERFNNAINSATKLLKGTKGEAAINLLAERIYQMGLPEISTWNNTLRLLREGNFKEAANESVRNRKGGKAKWVKQTGASRVNSFKKRLKNLQKGNK